MVSVPFENIAFYMIRILVGYNPNRIDNVYQLSKVLINIAMGIMKMFLKLFKKTLY